MSMRLQAMGQAKYANGFNVTLHEDELDAPRRWRKPRTVFVCSMSDLFHVPSEFIDRVFATMHECPQHIFQVLTKRARRMARFPVEWRPNIWAGVSVENEVEAHRLDALAELAVAETRFVSLEPLLGPVNLADGGHLQWLDWVIVGGESGPNARPMKYTWVRDLRDQCVEAGVPFFFKQWGGPQKQVKPVLLDGKEWREFPD
jgi:protein gp37